MCEDAAGGRGHHQPSPRSPPLQPAQTGCAALVSLSHSRFFSTFTSLFQLSSDDWGHLGTVGDSTSLYSVSAAGKKREFTKCPFKSLHLSSGSNISFCCGWTTLLSSPPVLCPVNPPGVRTRTVDTFVILQLLVSFFQL